MLPQDDRTENQSINPQETKPDGVHAAFSRIQPSKKWNRKKIILSVLLLVLAVGGILFALSLDLNSSQTGSREVQPAVIVMNEVGFSPNTLTIKAGSSVTWTNEDASPHHVTSEPFPSNDALPELNSEGPLQNGDSYTFVFEEPGTFHYHDQINPYEYKGTIIVE
jgi:plastocyanin